MKPIFDVEAWRTQVESSFARMTEAVAEYLPLIVGAVVLLLVGWVLARLARAVVSWVLHRAGFDQAISRLRLTETFQRSGITSPPSRILGGVTFWVVLLVFVRAALELLSLAVVSTAIDRLLAYLPSLLSATLIILLGLWLADIARNLLTSAAVTVQVARAELVGGVAHALVVLVTAIIALERLGLDTQLFVVLLTALVATFGLTMGLAFALGAKPIVTHILAGHFLRQRLPQDAIIEVGGHRGTVVRVGSVDTVIREGDREWSIPNAQLVDEVVAR